MWTYKKKVLYIIYTIFAKWLPQSSHSLISKKIRFIFGKSIMDECGENVNIEKGAVFSPTVKIGNNSGVGIKSEIYGYATIGNDVMMGPEVVIYTQNHNHNCDDSFYKQGYEDHKFVKIGDNVWIGRRAMFMPGSEVGNNVVVSAGSVVTKKFGNNVIIGGVPARIIKNIED